MAQRSTEIDDISIIAESVALAATLTVSAVAATVVVGFGLASESPILMVLLGLVGIVMMAVPIVAQINNIVNKKLENQ